ncbi:hypothetical protein [Microbacterium sp. Root180]|uniref:hypothetical protein n=1 Tax=Microbacterium sp. Root180 TaxID=1736483 RepID=UPI000B2F1A06|nr:hypothetical protein [Microbacterium sp. Root180]
MAQLIWRRIAIAAVVIGGFGLYLVSIVARWDIPWWAVVLASGCAIAFISALSRRPPRRAAAPELYASDGYSDAHLGRTRPTHPFNDPAPTSQIGRPLPLDPIDLPGASRRPAQP